jgi:hypothetical protein
MLGDFTLKLTKVLISSDDEKAPTDSYRAIGRGRTSMIAMKEAISMINFSFHLTTDEIIAIACHAMTRHVITEFDQSELDDCMQYRMTILYTIGEQNE